MRVLAFGEILWDVYPDKKCLGGASLNFGAHLAKHGEEVYMLSAVGKDTLGKEAVEQVKAWGMQDAYISVLDTKETGQCLVSLDEHFVPSYDLLSDVAYDYIACDNITDDFDALYFGTLALRGDYNYRALNGLLATKTFKSIFVDVNVRPPFCYPKTLTFAVSHATILKVSLEEMATVAEMLQMDQPKDHEQFAAALADKFENLKLIILTLGKDGAFAYDCVSKIGCFAAAFPTKVISTVGAGDSFSAAFLHKYMKGSDMPACLQYANAVARKVVSEMDAVPEYRPSDF